MESKPIVLKSGSLSFGEEGVKVYEHEDIVSNNIHELLGGICARFNEIADESKPISPYLVLPPADGVNAV